MDITSEKIYLAQLILATENPGILEAIKEVFCREQKDFWVDMPPQHQTIINQGIADLDQGKKVSLSDFLKQHE